MTAVVRGRRTTRMMRCFMRSRYGSGCGKGSSAAGDSADRQFRRTYVELKRHIRSAALLVGGGGMSLAILLSSWRGAGDGPVERLAHARRKLRRENWNVRVEVSGGDELGQLADSSIE